MLNLFYNYTDVVEKAYIITIRGHELSEFHSKKCQQSCDSVGMLYQVWDAYDGTQESDKIVEPEHLLNDEFMSMLKLTNHHLSSGQICCLLSHISLWKHCVMINQPIVILEHDAIMIKKFDCIKTLNAITYLGSREWVSGQSLFKENFPLYGGDGHNYTFMHGTQAYAIDPMMAKNLLAHVLHFGIHKSADMLIRTDLFNITQQGVYAFDDPTAMSVKPEPEKLNYQKPISDKGNIS